MQTIKIKKISITDVNTEIIVNAANAQLLHGSGVCGYIFRAAGARQLQEACDQIGYCKTGHAVITPGLNLCKYIVHAVGPIWYGGDRNEPRDLYSCYRSALGLAKEYDCHSIGFPLISAGIYGYPVEGAWQQALKAVADWCESFPDYDINIIFAILDDRIIETGKRVAADLEIDLA